jgi:phosphatidylinositol alpha 1,6-mannosyltransferase
VVRVRSLGLPRYRSFPLGLPDAAVERALAQFRPHVVHLASPICLGAVGLRAARRWGIPALAVYQTDIAGFARQYGVRADLIVDRWVGRIHRRCARTLVPSRSSYAQLEAMGVPDVHVWRRGVSLDLFDPGQRDRRLRAEWSGGKDVVVGYVGRIAAEKEIRRLVGLAQLPGIKLVMIGDGPARGWLEERLPDATFTGMLGGEELARAFASLDVFVHPGTSETFCQTVQEAQASGVPVVAAAAGGPLDLIEPGETGLLFDPADPASLVDAVATFAGDAELRDRVAAAALRTVSTRSWAHLVRELVEDHYLPLVTTGDLTDRAA